MPVPSDWHLLGTASRSTSTSATLFRRRGPTSPTSRTRWASTPTFTVPSSWRGQRVTLHFGGVNSAFYVWVNGQEVGYSQDSKVPAEFDVTDVVEYGAGNEIAVEVYRWNDGSYLENQDFWAAGGHRARGLFGGRAERPPPRPRRAGRARRRVPRRHARPDRHARPPRRRPRPGHDDGPRRPARRRRQPQRDLERDGPRSASGGAGRPRRRSGACSPTSASGRPRRPTSTRSSSRSSATAHALRRPARPRLPRRADRGRPAQGERPADHGPRREPPRARTRSRAT